MRLDISPYQRDDFRMLERNSLKQLGVDYIQNIDEICENKKLILISNTSTKFEGIDLFYRDNVAAIVHPNSGYDNIPEELIKKSKYPIIIGNPIRAHAVASYTLSALFQHTSPIFGRREWDNKRSWVRSPLQHMSVLLIGYGHIGKILEASVKHLVKDFHIYDPFKGYEAYPDLKWDVVLVAAGLNKTSKHMINSEFLKKLSPSALVINPARGKIIKQNDLKLFLKSNPKSFAFVDVYEKEPYDRGEFDDVFNIITTSHIAGVFNGLDDSIINFVSDTCSNIRNHGDNWPRFKNMYSDLLLENRVVNGIVI